MRLRKFRVRAYRCIHDSGEITVGDLAAFVGRNESGKTTILQALTLLNRDEQISCKFERNNNPSHSRNWLRR